MSVSAINNQFPRFGWNRKTLLNLDTANETALGTSVGLTSGSLISESMPRPAGLHFVGVQLVIAAGLPNWSPAFDTANRVNVLLEGSNNNVSPETVNENWTTITELDTRNYLSGQISTGASAQIRLLGATISGAASEFLTQGEGSVSVQRYKYLRIRAEIVDDGKINPTFALAVKMTGVQGDSEEFDREYLANIPSGSGGPSVTTIASGMPFLRPAGVRYMNVQLVVDDIDLDGGAGSFTVILEGALDNDSDAVFFTIGTAVELKTIGQSLFVIQGQQELIDMGPFQYFRYILEDNSNGGGLQRCTTTAFFSFDGNDVSQGEVPLSLLSETIKDVFIRVVTDPLIIASSTGGIGGTVDVSVQILDMNGRPIREERPIRVRLVQPDTGLMTPSTAGGFTAIVEGSQPIGFQSNDLGPPPGPGVVDMVFITNSEGIGTLTLTALAVVPSQLFYADNYVPASGTFRPQEVLVGQVIIQSSRLYVSFDA